MVCVWPAEQGFFPLDEELQLLPGKLTPREHESLVRLSGWMPFEQAVELLEEVLGVEVSKIVAQNYTEAAGAAYVVLQEEEVAWLEENMPEPKEETDKLQISADGAMVPLLHGIWAEVRTLVVGEVQSRKLANGEPEVHTRHLSYFSRKVSAQEFQRQALVEIQRRGVERARAVAAVMDGADWEQGFVDFHCPQALRILDFAHAAEHLHAIGEFLHGEHTPESQTWLKDQAHRLKHEGPEQLLRELMELQRQQPQAEILSSNLAYLKKRKEQMQYPRFQALGWPIGSGAVESGNKLVVQARLKGAGMHWAESHVNPMLAIRNILCSGRWREEWPRIESKLRLLAQQRQRQRYRSRHPLPPTSRVARALQGDFDPLPVDPPTPPKPKNNSWRNFKYGKALFQRPVPPKL
jgi:hypothetical protein